MSYNSKNYHESTDKWVIGGTLEIADGASLIGSPKAENQVASKATSNADLRADFNLLLENLKAAGLMKASVERGGSPHES